MDIEENPTSELSTTGYQPIPTLGSYQPITGPKPEIRPVEIPTSQIPKVKLILPPPTTTSPAIIENLQLMDINPPEASVILLAQDLINYLVSHTKSYYFNISSAPSTVP